MTPSFTALALLALLRQSPESATVRIDGDHPIRSFSPAATLGAALDGHGEGDLAVIYTPANIRAMRSAGFERMTYRLRTELGNEVWHWNPRGRWSDAAHHQGYWTSDSTLRALIRISHGYALPRRGNTIDQANNAGYSRLDDGDLSTFWKSNPYLDSVFTHESNERHPQWVVIELNDSLPVSAMVIAWGEPFAVRYRVQYWSGEEPGGPDADVNGRWLDFPGGIRDHGSGALDTVRLADVPVRAQWIRLLLIRGSRSAPPGSRDVRDTLGFAIRELLLGTLDSTGKLHDVIQHDTTHETQTIMRVSSTDPWHRARDLDRGVEQPGLDYLFRSPLIGRKPMLVPVGVLYDTPANAAAEVAYLMARRYHLERVELGEEPDGQYVAPEDYAALHLQVAEAVRRVSATLVLGGPSYQAPEAGAMFIWRDAMPALASRPSATAAGKEELPGAEHRSWTARFVDALRDRDALWSLRFLTFEWYPFDDVCSSPQPQLLDAPARMDTALALLARAGVPPDVPLDITEYGWSAFAGSPEVELVGGLLNADIVGRFLTDGGERAYLYGTEPSTLEDELGCNSWGDNTLFLADDQRHIKAHTATYWSARLLTREWVRPGDGAHVVYPVSVDPSGSASPASDGAERPKGEDRPLLTAYAVRRPDSLWSLMLINKDSSTTRRVRVVLHARTADLLLVGAATMVQFSGAQYQWRADGPRGHPLRSEAPSVRSIQLGADSAITLPPHSITIVRTHGA